MLDIAPTELLLVAVVALLVIGPKDLPRVMRTVGHWVGKARATAGRGVIVLADRIDDRVLIDLSVEVDVLSNVSLFGSVQNLFDVTYNAAFSPAGARPGAPRLALGGIRARF